MITFLKCLLIASLLFIFIKNSKKINQILEKRVILKMLLLAVSIFIKIDNKNSGTIKNRVSKYVSEKLLFLDIWILNFRSIHKSEKLFIKENKKHFKDPDC